MIGVAADSVRNGRGPNNQSDLLYGDGWIPFVDQSIVDGVATTDRNQARLEVVARIPAGISLQTVATEVGGIGAALDRTAPIRRGDTASSPPIRRSWSALTAAEVAREQTAGKIGQALVLLVGLVLVVACTNIANLTLGRGASRVHEFSVRRALGASYGRLVREQCAESVVLATCGGCGGLLLAEVLCHYFTTDFPTGTASVVFPLHPKLDASALLAAGGSLLVSLVVFGVVPALQLTRASLRERLAGEGAGAPPSRWKGRRLLIALQVMISTAFLLISFASTRAVTAEERHDFGFDLQHLAVGYVSFRSMHWDTARTQRTIEALDAAARAQRGFESVAVTTGLPMGGRGRQFARVWAADQPVTLQTDLPSTLGFASTPEIVRALGVPILRGRGFDSRDRPSTTPVIVTSEHVARQVFGTTDVVGRQMSYQGESDATPKTVGVIGVVQDTDVWWQFGRMFDRSAGAVYVPLSQQDAALPALTGRAAVAAAAGFGPATTPPANPQAVFIVGRTAGDPAPMVRTLAGIVRRVDPDLAVDGATTGPSALTPGYVVLGVVARLSGGLSVLVVALAMLGLYGVLSHVVARRTREIGLRLALGAEANRVRRMIVGAGLRPVVWGLAAGFFVGTGARLVLRATNIGPNTAAIDPLAFIVVALTLVTAGLSACYLPARRASKVDPNVALREL